MHSEVACIMAILAMVLAGSVLAAITPEEAAQLGKNLTALGAEKAGNADGTIPEYTGGLRTPPAGFVSGSGKWPDPYVNEKPLFSITAQNMAQYKDKLTEGFKAIFSTYPSFRMDVYQTHRSFWVPKWVEENTVKYATQAKTADEGNSLKDVRCAYPFPIPKTGCEVVWNDLVMYRGIGVYEKLVEGLVDRSGRYVVSAEQEQFWEFPYWDPKTTEFEGYREYAIFNGPPRMAGELLLVHETINPLEYPRKAWQYLPGQRRVKLAPEVAFDTANLASSGILTYDETWGFNGSLERYDWKLIGKKEMYVPYNCAKSFEADSNNLQAQIIDPSFVRFELHRVWIVEGKLKEGKRHVYHLRRFYFDEDSWALLATELYDNSGKLWHVMMDLPLNNYEEGGMFVNQTYNFDLLGHAMVWRRFGKEGLIKFAKERKPTAFFQPDALAGRGVR